jgi:enterochelin esterase-like enzyme
MCHFEKVIVLLLALGGTARAQAPGDSVQSPQVHPDGKVTFRLRAPRAAAVTVAGEWTMPPNKAEAMTRDAQGVWSVTVGPVEPNIYIYGFEVDGVTIADPVNPLVKLRARGAASMVEVPGGQPWDFRDVPHGTLEVHSHASTVLEGAMRQVVVYTPPGYARGNTRYPILYLLHGNNDMAVGWTMAGRAHLILDNFINDKKALPMIVVMPWGHALPFGTKPAAGQPSNNDVFEQYLLKDVMPLVEGRYRVASGRRNRAIVGLSMGGAQAVQIGLHHRELFASIGVFGNGLTAADLEAHHAKDVAGMARDKNRLALFYVGVAKGDGARDRARSLADAMQVRGVPTVFHEIEGGHTYPVWRKLLVDTAPRLFRKAASVASVE